MAAKKSYPMPEARGGGWEEQTQVQGEVAARVQEGLEVRRGCGEEIPHAQGKRNPSKTVGIARGHQRTDTLKPYSEKTSQSNHTRATTLSNSMKRSHARRAT